MPPQPCNVSEDCLKYFSCATPSTPIDGAIYAPYVEMGFGSLEQETKIVLTVGNNSAPTGNLAGISNFTYGSEVGGPGFGVEMEIIDHGGAMYKEIIRNLNKSVSKRGKEVMQVSIDFGWIIYANPDMGGMPIMKTLRTMQGKVIRGMFRKVDTSFSGGNVVMKLTLSAPVVEDVALDGTIGSTDQPVDLKEAITELLTREDVGFSEVQFRSATIVDKDGNVTQDGGELEFKNSEGGKDGPKSSWPMDQMNALAIVRQWLTTVTSAEGRGLLILYDNENNSVIIHEDPLDPEGADGGCCKTSVATYVVNGGNCSPVLEFNPSVEWVPGMIPGKGGINGGPSGGAAPLLEPINNVQPTGTQSSPFIDQHVWNFRSPDDQADAANEAFSANSETEQRSGPGTSGGKGGWTCDLKIIGDPYYGDPLKMIGRSVSIVFINPYYFGDPDLPTWLQTSNCNSMLSNKRYNIKAVSHNITKGSYTTTLKLLLTIPNIDVDWDSPLGGNGCGSIDQKFADAPAESAVE